MIVMPLIDASFPKGANSKIALYRYAVREERDLYLYRKHT